MHCFGKMYDKFKNVRAFSKYSKSCYRRGKLFNGGGEKRGMQKKITVLRIATDGESSYRRFFSKGNRCDKWYCFVF